MIPARQETTMILDSLPRWRRYASLNPLFPKAFAFLEEVTPAVADGRHEIDGDAVFALVQRYETRLAAGQPEAHRRYVDVQFIVAGREVIQWAPLGSLTEVTKPYDDAKDAGFFADGGALVPIRVAAGQFAILFPDDAHAPCCAWAGPEAVVKVVVKVAVSTPA
jgi:YhcH/YjgK/YiaL family protein